MIIDVNGIRMNYEVYGEGLPMVLVHGNGDTHEIFDKLIQSLQSKYRVYAIDSRCHGQSENTKEISYNLMAQDTISFIKTLNISNPILYGHSDGGIIGLLVAIKEPGFLSKLITTGATISPVKDSVAKKYIIMTKIAYFFKRDKLIKMMIKEPNISLQELQTISIPVHLIVGENDVIKLEHTNLIANNIKNSTLEIVKDESHSSYVSHSDKIYEIISKYL